MNTTLSQSMRHRLGVVAGAALFAACADGTPLAPNVPPPARTQLATASAEEDARTLSTIRRVTSRYHDLQAALDDGFVFLHDCETRPEEGPVGIVYVHLGRLGDGTVDPELPDALIYEPRRTGAPRLVGVELAVPDDPNTDEPPPQFLGATFQTEPEFGVFGLHVWVWRTNPAGLFAETNRRVSCDAE